MLLRVGAILLSLSSIPVLLGLGLRILVPVVEYLVHILAGHGSLGLSAMAGF